MSKILLDPAVFLSFSKFVHFPPSTKMEDGKIVRIFEFYGTSTSIRYVIRKRDIIDKTKLFDIKIYDSL